MGMRRHAARVTLLWLATLGVVAVAPVLAVAQPAARPHYAITVRLEPERQRAQLGQRIAFQNRSRAPLDALIFHLYPNAFASTRTVFMREGGTSLRGQRLERTGGLTLTKLELAGGPSLLATAHAFGPIDDATQLRVPLPRPLAPGERIELVLEAELRLPSMVARMGQAGDFCMLAQFYPKLARLEPDGTFASYPYHGLGEFYADFADHELVIEVPERFVIAAPGVRMESKTSSPGLRRERYVLRNALDVAFAAAPDLVRVRTRAHGVAIEAFAPRGHLRLAREQLALVAEGLGALARELGSYPYTRLVVVLPPYAARGAEGMEYPGLVLTQRVSVLSEPLTLGAIHDVVTTHELAHQWFPIALGTDELHFPWLDEGIAQWLGTHLLRERYGPRSRAAQLIGLPLEPFAVQRASLRLWSALPSSLEPAPRYRPRQLTAAVYLRPALALESIARAWGRPRLLRTLGSFARAQRFAHPRPEQLFAAFDSGYWLGFSANVLRPLLEGRAPSARMPAHAALLHPEPARLQASAPSGGPPRGTPTMLTRLLTLAHAALGLLGP
jgi:hypothetical protein